jgi:hypothetical protein
MAGMVRSIFGLTTEEVRQKQLEQQQEMAAQLQREQGTSPFAATFGTAFGSAIGRGLLSKLGYEDPEMAKAKEVEAAQTALDDQLAGLEQDDPKRLYLIGQALIEAGKPEEATRYFALARQFETGEEELALRREQMEDTETGRAARTFTLLSDPIRGLTTKQIMETMKVFHPDVKLPELEEAASTSTAKATSNPNEIEFSSKF